METDAERIVLQELSEAECVHLLRVTHLGRIAVAPGGEPVVLPVNYALDGDLVVFSTGTGSLLAQASGHRVAFEIDSADPLYHEGWSVLVGGRMDRITDATDLARVSRLPVRAWVTPRHSCWMRVVPTTLSGRRIRRG